MSDNAPEQTFDQAVRETPMFQAPDMWVNGSGRHLSPIQFFALTNEMRADLDGLDIDEFGLVEERITRVDKRGVELFTRLYFSPELLPYVTGDKKSPQRNLVVRYDRALAARGVLHDVQFLERDDQGRAVKRILLQPHDSPAAQMSRDDLMKARNAYMHTLMKTRSKAEIAYMLMQDNGIAVADKLMADVEARRRLQRIKPPAPKPATPIVDTADGHDQEDRYREALQNADVWAGEVGPSSVEAAAKDSADGDAPDQPNAPQEHEISDVAEAATPDADDADIASPLADALGGSMGFREHETE